MGTCPGWDLGAYLVERTSKDGARPSCKLYLYCLLQSVLLLTQHKVQVTPVRFMPIIFYSTSFLSSSVCGVSIWYTCLSVQFDNGGIRKAIEEATALVESLATLSLYPPACPRSSAIVMGA